MTNNGPKQLSREQKHALAALLLSKAGDIAQFWDEETADVPELAKGDRRAALAQLTAWLKYLPGGAWDKRLPQAK